MHDFMLVADPIAETEKAGTGLTRRTSAGSANDWLGPFLRLFR
jgi:hypothetical protein